MSTALVYTTYNRTPLLRRSLERLKELTLPDEIIVVDDGGDDDCEAACAEIARWFVVPLRYIYTHQPGQSMCSHARNVALHATDADVLITSEPEMLFDTDVVAQMTADHEQDLVWGTRRIVNVGKVHHAQHPSQTRCGCGCGQTKHTTVNWAATWITLYRRDWLLAVGGWDETFPDHWGWDDVDLCTRLRISGVGQYNDLDIEATHQWHQSNQCDQSRNEAHFKNKGFHGDERVDHPELVANRHVSGVGEAKPRD